MKTKKNMVFLTVILITLLLNGYIRITYKVSLVEIVFSNNTLTQNEKDFLKGKKSLIYGADYNAPPLRSVNATSGQYEGIVIDYLSALSLSLSTNITKEPMIWSDALEALKNGDIDFCDMHPSEERKKLYDFSKPIYHQRGGILVPIDSISIQSKKDLEGKTIAAIEGDYVIEFANTHFNDLKIRTQIDLKKAIKSLERGEVEAVLGDESVIHYFITEENLSNQFVLLNDYLYEREAVFGVRKGEKTLLNILNKGIAILEREKTMNQITSKWSPLITKDSSSEDFKTLLFYGLLVIVILSVFFYLWNIELKKEVKKQTKALSHSNQLLETTFNGLSHQLLLLVDSECLVLEANEAFCKFVKIPHRELLGKHCSKVQGLLGETCENCMIKETFKTRTNDKKEIQYQGKTYIAQSYFISNQEDLERVLLMFEDITDIKIAQRDILKNSKMAALGQLSAGIAHEIRTPLGIIRNSSYFLKKVNSDPKNLETIESIEKATTRANSIIDNLLNFSRISDYNYKVMNLYTFVEELVTLNKKAFDTNGIKIDITISKTLVLSIPEEPLKHILINLIGNAISAIDQDGFIEVSASSTETHIHFSVKDNGSGIPEAIQPYIFDPFFTTKSSSNGTGLGLYIVFNEVEKLGGDISFESNAPIGTLFTVSIPKGDPS